MQLRADASQRQAPTPCPGCHHTALPGSNPLDIPVLECQQSRIGEGSLTLRPLTYFPRPHTLHPKTTAVVEKMGTTSPRAQSALLEAITPSSRVRGWLKMDHAYSEPIDAWMASTGGMASHRLNPSAGTIFSLDSQPGLGWACTQDRCEWKCNKQVHAQE